jgi:hypothetical protein
LINCCIHRHNQSSASVLSSVLKLKKTWFY